MTAPYFHFYADNWLSGTLGMPYDEKGFYIDLLAKMWDEQGPLTANPKMLGAALQQDPRRVASLLSKLVARGKLELVDGLIVNSRMMRDIAQRQAYVEHGKKGGRPPTSHPTSPRLPPQLPSEVSEKSNPNIPGNSTKSTSDGNPSTPISTPTERETVNARDELKAAFNGSTASMLADVQAWMPCEPAIARKWLQTTLTACGQEATAQAYQILVAKQAQGEVVPSPIPFWGKTAASLKRNGAAGSSASVTRLPMKSFAERERERNIRAQARWVR